MRWPWQRPAPDVEDRLEKLERRFAALSLEWDETQGKLFRLAGRLAKADKRAALRQMQQLEEQDPEDIPRDTQNGWR
jgi:hypothetical protein